METHEKLTPHASPNVFQRHPSLHLTWKRRASRAKRGEWGMTVLSQTNGKLMENAWKTHWKFIENWWQTNGTFMGNSRKANGKRMGNPWQTNGNLMENSCKFSYIVQSMASHREARSEPSEATRMSHYSLPEPAHAQLHLQTLAFLYSRLRMPTHAWTC